MNAGSHGYWRRARSGLFRRELFGDVTFCLSDDLENVLCCYPAANLVASGAGYRSQASNSRSGIQMHTPASRAKLMMATCSSRVYLDHRPGALTDRRRIMPRQYLSLSPPALPKMNYGTASRVPQPGLVRRLGVASTTTRRVAQHPLCSAVRPGPAQQANTTGVTNNYNLTTNAPTNVAIGSRNFSQTITPSGEQAEGLLAVADALQRLLASQEPVDEDRVRALAEDLRTAAAEPEQDKNKLMALLSNVIGTVTVAAGSELGQQVTDLAVGAIQSLG